MTICKSEFHEAIRERAEQLLAARGRKVGDCWEVDDPAIIEQIAAIPLPGSLLDTSPLASAYAITILAGSGRVETHSLAWQSGSFIAEEDATGHYKGAGSLKYLRDDGKHGALRIEVSLTRRDGGWIAERTIEALTEARHLAGERAGAEPVGDYGNGLAVS